MAKDTQATMDPAMAILMGINEVDTKGAVQAIREEEKKELDNKPPTPEKKEPKPKPAKKAPSGEEKPAKGLPVTVPISFRTSTVKRFRMVMLTESIIAGRQIGNTEFLERLLDEHLKALPKEDREFIERNMQRG